MHHNELHIFSDYFAVLGNYFFRYLFKRIEFSSNKLNLTSTKKLTREPSVQEILATWGVKRERAISSVSAIPLHSSFAAVFEEYEFVGPDEYFQVLRRSLATRFYADNSNFVQIGIWGDGSEIVVSRDINDAHVYIMSIEDATPNKPELFSENLDAYLIECWLYEKS